MLQNIICISALTFALAASSFGQAARFSVIGGYGFDSGGNEAAVAQLVKSWNPDFIITLGGNNYPNGDAATIDRNVGQYFHEYIYNYQGSYGAGSTTQKFFPSLGEQDYKTAGASPYFDYFTLPGNERYYDFVKGDVHFFVLDSNPQTLDGVAADGVQGTWLKAGLAAAAETWKIVYFYHSPYSSGSHGANHYMRWDFKNWGATVVLTGEDNDYERLRVNDFPYLVNGLGGRSGNDFNKISASSRFRYNETFGAIKAEAYENILQFQFYNRNGVLIDNLTLQALAAPVSLSAVESFSNGIELSWIDSSSAEQGFRIERSFDGIKFLPVGTVGANQTKFFAKQPPAYRQVYYRVKAFRNNEESLHSNLESPKYTNITDLE